jgi:hypothetical protein
MGRKPYDASNALPPQVSYYQQINVNCKRKKKQKRKSNNNTTTNKE